MKHASKLLEKTAVFCGFFAFSDYRFTIRHIEPTYTMINQKLQRRRAFVDENRIQPFQNKHIRTAWDEDKQEWFLSVSDVVAVLTDSTDVKQYVKKMRSRDPELNSKWGTICTPVEMIAADGKTSHSSRGQKGDLAYNPIHHIS
jgi:hypothetical protein